MRGKLSKEISKAGLHGAIFFLALETQFLQIQCDLMDHQSCSLAIVHNCFGRIALPAPDKYCSVYLHPETCFPLCNEDHKDITIRVMWP